MADPGGRSPNKTRRAAGKKAAVAEQKRAKSQPDSRNSTADHFNKYLRRMVTSRQAKDSLRDIPKMGAASLASLHSLLWGCAIDGSEAYSALHKACRDALHDGKKRGADSFDFPAEVLQGLLEAQTGLMSVIAKLAPQITKINKVWLDFELDADGSEVTIKSDDFHALMKQYSAMMQAVLQELGPEKYAEVMTRVTAMQREEAEAATVH